MIISKIFLLSYEWDDDYLVRTQTYPNNEREWTF
jgi:hypothetical protein